MEDLSNLHDYVLIAVDQPTVVPNDSGARPVESVVASLNGKLGSGVQPANRQRVEFFGNNAPIWRFIDRIKAR